MKVTPTGITALDLFLGGGLPDGFTTLLLAPSGSGAEIFAKQFACGRPGAHTIYVTTEESKEEVEIAMDQGGWPRTHVTITDLQSDFAERMIAAHEEGDAFGTGSRRRFDPRDLVEGTTSTDMLRNTAPVAPGQSDQHDYLGRLMDPYAQTERPARMVVHSLDFFLNLYKLDRLVATITALKAANARSGGQLLLVMAKGAHGDTLERRMELIADCLIELEVTRKGTSFERYFMVKKVKNRSHGVGISTYDITQRGFHLETLERIV